MKNIEKKENDIKRNKIIGTFLDFPFKPKSRKEVFEINKQEETFKIFKKAQDIDWYVNKTKLQFQKIIGNKKGKYNSYVISSLNNRDKKSLEYKNCNGICLAGKDKKTGQNISVITHQCPTELFNLNRKTFTLETTKSGSAFFNDLSKSIKLFLEKTQEQGRDIVLFAGNYFNHLNPYAEGKNVDDIRENAHFYKEIMKYFLDFIDKESGMKSHIISGPNMYYGGTGILYDNANRRIYTMRYSGSYNGSNENTDIKDIDDYIKMLNKEISYKEYLQKKYSSDVAKEFDKKISSKEIKDQINTLFSNSLFLTDKIDDGDRSMIKMAIIRNESIDKISDILGIKINVGIYDYLRELYQLKKYLEDDVFENK